MKYFKAAIKFLKEVLEFNIILLHSAYRNFGRILFIILIKFWANRVKFLGFWDFWEIHVSSK